MGEHNGERDDSVMALEVFDVTNEVHINEHRRTNRSSNFWWNEGFLIEKGKQARPQRHVDCVERDRMNVSSDTQGLNEVNLSRWNNTGETNEDARSGGVSTQGDRSFETLGERLQAHNERSEMGKWVRNHDAYLQHQKRMRLNQKETTEGRNKGRVTCGRPTRGGQRVLGVDKEHRQGLRETEQERIIGRKQGRQSEQVGTHWGIRVTRKCSSIGTGRQPRRL